MSVTANALLHFRAFNIIHSKQYRPLVLQNSIYSRGLSRPLIRRTFCEGNGLRQRVSKTREFDTTHIYKDPVQFPVGNYRPSLFGSLVFVVAVCTGSYFGAAYLTRRRDEELRQKTSRSRGGRLLIVEGSTREQSRETNLPQFAQQLYLRAQRFWLSKRDSEQATLTIIAVNALVFLAWRISRPNVQAFMLKHFTHSSLSGRDYTLLTSVFSHQNPLHFAINMIAFYSFGPAAFEYLHRTALVESRPHSLSSSPSDELNMYRSTAPRSQSTSFYHSIAFFITAGTVASFVPHAINILYRLPRTPPAVLQSLFINPKPTPLTATSPSTTPREVPLIAMQSLGASGSLYSLFTLTALAYPSATVSLVFFPFVPIKIQHAVLGVVAFDVVGVVRGWRMFGHLGHLTGAAVGAMSWYGHAEARAWAWWARAVEEVVK